MAFWSIRYFYLATGMEGIPDERLCGIWPGESDKEAIEAYLSNAYPDGGRAKDFERGCLTASCIGTFQ